MDVSLNKEKIAKCFLRGQETYDRNAIVQKKVSEKLVTLLGAHPEISYGRVLEIGCCTGTLTSELLSRHTIDKLFLNDLVPEFYDAVLERLPAKHCECLEPRFGDVELVDLPPQLDLVISSSTFQWLTDLQGLFNRIFEALADDGYFVFSLFGPGTLLEFKELTGIGLKYKSLEAIVEMLEDRFYIDFVDTRTDVLFFETPRDLLRHLKATGVGGVKDHRWSNSGIKKFENEYVQKFGTAEGIPATFISSYVVASKKSGEIK